MDIVVVSISALIAAGLTLFSGFGLGTLLMPVVALFFSLDIAIAITAIVHLANNFFKGMLFARHTHWPVFARFGLPALLFVFVGALLLHYLSSAPALFEYSLGDTQVQISAVKALVGVLIIGFVLLELSPRFAAIEMPSRYLPIGGVLSGFFGGLSGHQGAFRSMFLLKSGLTKEQFIATGVMLAILVDVARLTLYGWNQAEWQLIDWQLVTCATLAAFAGAFVGARLLTKVTIAAVQKAVSIMLIVIACGFISGLL
ncbi:TSUP family transporter [Neptunicella sp. SCSIO 80796]|uniref:TSUP family transporter n=1 Tax=Neptunicella plasticusilytica TaxID=3117012 RepID=UPI003A4E2513